MRSNFEGTIEERRNKVLELFKAHKSISAICREIGLHRKTITNDLKFLNVSKRDIDVNALVARRTKWIDAIQSILDDAIPYFKSQGIKPSLRTVYYRLRARGLVKNTESDYKGLTLHTREARLKETDMYGQLLYPKLAIDCFADETRRLIENYSDYNPEEVQDPDEYVDDAIQTLTDSIRDYDGKGKPGGRWYEQPEYVEAWIEKFADAPTFEKWLEDKDVNIVVNKGYTSLSFLWENIQRLKIMVKHFGMKHVHVLYFGDFDPSGEDMVKSLKKYFRRFGLSASIIEKAALTQQQIDDYEIPLEPIKDTDSRSAGFEAEYGEDGGAEIDAFIAIAPEALKKIVRDSVDEYFDQKIFDKMEEDYKTSTPLNELKDIHDNMIYKVQNAFESKWKFDLKKELNEEYNDYQEEEESEDEDEDENDDDSSDNSENE